MNQLKIIEHQNQRVLTTTQLAESYGTNNRRISENFNRNEKRFKEGKHFYSLQGDEKHNFLDHTQIADGSRNAQTLYLWTEKGAWLHAKSLNTDEAWDAYEMLVDDYYEIKQPQIDTSRLSPELQMFNQLFTAVAETQIDMQKQSKRLDQIEQEQKRSYEIFSLDTGSDWKDKTNAILNRIAMRLGGGEQYRAIRTKSYDILEKRARCRLNVRLENAKKEAYARGVLSPTKIKGISKLDVIANDTRLTEIYITIVKELAIAHEVNHEGLGA